MLQELLKLIQEEQKLYSIRRDQHIHSMELLFDQQPQDSDQLPEQCFQELVELKNIAQNVQSEVEIIQKQADAAMQSFETLRYQKQNIESVLDTASALIELKRIKASLPQTIQSKDLDRCLKLAQNFQLIEHTPVLKEFSIIDFQNVKQTLDIDLVKLQKEQFEDALKKNDLSKINTCACLAKVLKQESEHSLEKVQEVHEKELRKKLKELEETMFEKVNTKYEDYIQVLMENALTDDQKQYDFPFLWHFVTILEKVNEQCERFVTSILGFYGEEGLNNLVKYLIQNVSAPFLIGVLRKVSNFYSFQPKQVQTKKETKQGVRVPLVQAITRENLGQQENDILNKVSLFCEEVCTMAGQLNQFLLHISQVGSKDNKEKMIKPEFQDLTVNTEMIYLLGTYLEQAKTQVYMQLFMMFQKSESLQTLWNFDKNKISQLTDLREQLHGNSFHEWLEEAFYVLKQALKTAISCGNQMITSAFINYVSNDLIAEELYGVVTQLINRYLRKDYFSPQGICITSKFTVHNSFICLLINIISCIPRYLKMLKSQLYNEITSNYQQSQMIVAAIEEMVDQNNTKYQNFIQEKIKALADNLKLTTKNIFQQFRTLNFNVNESLIVEQEREYTKLFSQQFKQVYSTGLEQWSQQLTTQNYEDFMQQLSISIAKSLENIILQKQYHQMGAILLEKEIRSVVNFFASRSHSNLKQAFVRLQMICGTLMLESIRDMEDFLSSSALGELGAGEIKTIATLRVDLNNK